MTMTSAQRWRASRAFAARSCQRGSIIINAAFALLVIVIALSGTELGLLFMQKRELQKAADLAALAGARQLSVEPLTCPTDVVSESVAANLSVAAGARTVAPMCGHWSAPAAGSESTADGFSPASGVLSAVKITLTLNPVSIFSSIGERQLIASAVARIDQPLAAFSVGSRLVQVNGRSVLGRLLKSIGLDLSESMLVSYEGLAGLKVTPRGLLQALGIEVSADMGIGELNTLLVGRQMQLRGVLDAVVTAAGQSGLVAANLQLVSAIEAVLGVSDLDVQLGTEATSALRGVFARIVAPDGATSSALDAEINALDLLFAAIGVGTQKHAIAVNNLNVAGLVKARVAVVEPPSIAIGGIGATAYTAQVRTFVEVSSSNVPLLGSLVNVRLPVMVDAVTGRGTIQDMCTDELRLPDGSDRARIHVEAPVLKVCIGRPGANPSVEDQIFSTHASCETDLQNERLLAVNLLGANLVSLDTKLDIDALPMQGETVLAPGETKTVGNNPLALGTTLRNVTDALLAALLANSLDQAPALTAAQREAMAKDLWGTPPCTSQACRQQRLNAVKGRIGSASSGLTGFFGRLTSDSLGILNELLTLDLVGLVGQVGQLVSGLLQSVGNLLGSVLDLVTGNQCTGGGLVGSQGSEPGCIKEIADGLVGNSGTGSSQTPNAVIALVSFLMQLLQPILDSVGNAILRPILEDLLGLQLGQVDVHLQSLTCKAEPVLVQ